jgi:hypothetical protein
MKKVIGVKMNYRQQSQNNSTGLTLAILILGYIALRYQSVVTEINEAIINSYNFFTTAIGITYLLMIIGAIAFCVLLINKIYYLANFNIREYNERKQERDKQVNCIEQMLKQNISDIDDSKEMKGFILNLYKQLAISKKNKHLILYTAKIRARLNKAKELLKILKKQEVEEEREYRLIEEQERLKKEVEEAERQRQLEEWKFERETLNKVNFENNNVFYAKDLSLREINILKENYCVQVNEYCAYKQKIITILVKPVLNHSPTHTFLVHSISKVLQTIKGASNIIIHETRDADITFECNKQTYAIEIETGSLLKQPKQLSAKVAYLNSKYAKRWLFAISNEKLYPAYRNLGSVSPRRWVRENIEKMLKIRTRF